MFDLDQGRAGRRSERAALIALLRRSSGGWSRIACDVLERGSARRYLDELSGDRDALPLSVGGADQALAAAAEDLAKWESDGLGVHTVLDESYPAQLREIRDLPPVVFTTGRLVADTRAIAVVGTRRASPRGVQAATMVAEELARRQITIVSGLAAGIDTAAHEAALAGGGRTVAVIGTGIHRCYPEANRRLRDRIAAEGLVVSQFWPDAPPRKQQFPVRNAVMSGYAAGRW